MLIWLYDSWIFLLGTYKYLGAQSYPGRFDEIGHEWKLNTKEKVMNSDSLIYSLMTDSKFNLPKVLPDNKYAGFDIKLSN